VIENQLTHTQRSPPPIRDSPAAIAGHFDRLRHGPTVIKGSRFYLGGSGSAHETEVRVPCSTTVDARDLADLFLQYVFRLHGLPRTITSDRGPQFASAFWRRLCARLGIEPRQSTTFHLQTDGQTKQMNAVMEQYLRSYVNYLQDDWAYWLLITEFASNNHTSETTAVSLFFANLGYEPHWHFDLSAYLPNQAEDQRVRSAAKALSEIHDHLRSEMHRAQRHFQETTDTHRLPAPEYQVGDLVWLDT